MDTSNASFSPPGVPSLVFQFYMRILCYSFIKREWDLWVCSLEVGFLYLRAKGELVSMPLTLLIKKTNAHADRFLLTGDNER